MTLGKEELVEQAYFFKTLLQRIREAMPIQEVLASIEEEILATTDLPKAIAEFNFKAGTRTKEGVLLAAIHGSIQPERFSPDRAKSIKT